MSFITPILMTPSVYCACAMPQPKTSASVDRLSSRFILVLPFRRSIFSRSHAEIVVELRHIGVEFRIGELIDDAAILHHVVAVRNRRREAEVLLHQQDGETLLLEHADG